MKLFLQAMGLGAVMIGTSGCLPEDLADELFGGGDNPADCLTIAEQDFESCVRDGDLEACEAALDEALTACGEVIEENLPPRDEPGDEGDGEGIDEGEGPDGEGIDEGACFEEADRVFQSCIEEGADEEACIGEFEGVLDACFGEHSEPGEGPDEGWGHDGADGEAIDACLREAETDFELCLADDQEGEFDICADAFDRALEACFEGEGDWGEGDWGEGDWGEGDWDEECPDEVPGEDGWGHDGPDGDWGDDAEIDACLEEIDALARDCFENNDDPRECEALIDEGLRACFGDAGGEEPGDGDWGHDGDGDWGEGDDIDACLEEIDARVRDCFENNDDPRECEALIDEGFERCLGEGGDLPDEGPADEGPADPVEACIERAEGGFFACLEEGGDPWDCEMSAQDAFEACLADLDGGWDEGEHANGGEGGDRPADPIAECLEEVDAAHRACIESGERPRRCNRQADDAARACFDSAGL